MNAHRSTIRLTLFTSATAAVVALSATGCGDDGPGDGGGSAAASTVEPVYVYTIAVYGPDETLEYAVLRHDVDFDISLDDLASAHEFPGYTGVAAIGGRVITGDSETPFATKYEIGDDLSWNQVGSKLNFGDYFFAGEGDGLNFYFQSIRGNDMYYFHGAERTSRAHWNVEDWIIENDYTDTALPTRAGWTLNNAGNRTGVRDFAGPVVWPFNLGNDETDLVSDESWLAVYDPKTHAEKDVIEVPCPGIQQATKDEKGDLYFATTYEVPTRALYGQAPPACVVKVKANGTLDPSFPPNDLTEWTGGFYGVNFRYLGNGKAAANVLHHDRLTNVDFSGDVDPDVATRISGLWTDDGFVKPDASLWELHVIDLEQGTSTVVEGFKPEHDVDNYTIYFEVDGRTFINFQFNVTATTTYNAMYELDAETATVKPVGEIVGDLWGVERLR